MLTFDEAIPYYYDYEPVPFPTTYHPALVAVFWADVHTVNGGTIWYRYVCAHAVIAMVLSEKANKFSARWFTSDSLCIGPF